MSVNLTKGQKVDLTKKGGDGGGLRRVMVGLGWDEAKQKRGLFRKAPEAIDCDASAFVITAASDSIRNNKDIVYFGNLRHDSGCVTHQGDNLTGEGEGDDEQILVDLQRLSEDYSRIVFVVNIYRAKERKQHFGLVRNAFIRIVDADSGEELMIYNLSDDNEGMTALVFGEVYRKEGGWRFSAIGQATNDNDITTLARRFGLR